MCGIIGYVGYRPAAPILVDGLSRLEYRGYDSAGIVVFQKKKLGVFKKAGQLELLAKKIRGRDISGSIGLGHTRWATHGAPNDRNAHPHLDCQNRISLVHNGIIENYQSLRSFLEKKGHRFLSETDSETLVHLIEEYYQGDLLKAVNRALKKIQGSYAIAVMSADGEELVCARQDSPLLIGLGKDENYIASDAPALLAHTRQAYILNDGELARISSGKVEMFDSDGRPVKKKVFRISGEALAVEKGGYDHFMLKEIMEQPKAIADTLSGRIDSRNNTVDLKELSTSRKKINSFQRVYIVACGTSAHAGWVGRNIWEKLLGINVEVDLASEFRYRKPLVGAGDLVVVISQSGETADTLAALRLAKNKKAHVLGITNVIGSSLAREAHDVIYTRAGPEIAVASTKAYTAQLAALYLLAFHFGRIRNTISAKKEKELVRGLAEVPKFSQSLFSEKNLQQIKKYSQKLAEWDNAFFIGRGLDHVAAMEGALKLKEISYIHAEAYPAGELKHGTLALIDKNVPVIALSTQSFIQDKMINNIKEVVARQGKVLLITNSRKKHLTESAQEVFFLPLIDDLFAPILSTIPMQLIAYHAAVRRGCSVDKPRNLAKSVTVE